MTGPRLVSRLGHAEAAGIPLMGAGSVPEEPQELLEKQKDGEIEARRFSPAWIQSLLRDADRLLCELHFFWSQDKSDIG